jgi:hypothetical protein
MTEFFKRILSSKWDWDFHSWDLKVGLLLIGLYLFYQLYQRYRNDRAMRIASKLLILLVVLSFESLRVGPDKVEVARWHRRFWNLSKDNSRWTDVTIFSSKDNNG